MLIIFSVLFAVFCAGFIFIDNAVKPYVCDGLSSCIEASVSLEISKAVQQLLGDKSAEYSDIAQIKTDSNGNITAVSVSAAAVNEIKNGISVKLNESALQKNFYEYKAALGNLTNSVLLSGRGPFIKIKSMLNSFAVSDIESVFESAGINQTRHSLYLVITVDVSTQILLYKAHEQISTRVLIAETVIVGNVPASYFREG